MFLKLKILLPVVLFLATACSNRSIPISKNNSDNQRFVSHRKQTLETAPYRPLSKLLPPLYVRPEVKPSAVVFHATPFTPIVSQQTVVLNNRPSSQRLHRVRKGDSLSQLAQKYYNNKAMWKKIAEANQKTLSNPNLLIPGQMLVIP